MKKRNLIVVISVIILLSIIIFSSEKLNLEEIGKRYGYLGIFLVSLISCMTIVFPIPYIPAIIAISITTNLNPFWIGIFGGIGAVTGEFTGYALGRSGSRTISTKWENQFKRLKNFFERYGLWSIVLVSATPLPTGIMFLIAGMARYSVLRIFLAGAIGKIIFVTTVSYFGENIYSLSNLPNPVLIAIILIIALVIFLIWLSGKHNMVKKLMHID